MSPRLRFLAICLALLFAAPARAQDEPRIIPGEVLIKYRAMARPMDRMLVRDQVRAQTVKSFDNLRIEHVRLVGMTTEEAIASLRGNPQVEYAEPNYEVRALLTPNDPRFPELYGLRNTGQTGGTAGADIKATQAWDLYTGDPNLLVGVIDTGVDYNHPDLAANVWTNPGEIPGNSIDDDGNGFVDDVHGYDFSNNDGNPMDDNGHGTHVSGTIGAVGNNSVGVAGVNWNVKIVGIKFLSAGGSGSTAGAISSVQYATALRNQGHNIRLTSNSWGGGGFSQGLLDAINASGAAGMLFVAAAGNSSANTDASPHYPSSYNSPYIVAVAATDHNDNLASFSNFGATTVDLAAPGVNILSTLPGNAYGMLSGTSMACPHVSGAVALAFGRFPGVPELQIKNLLLNSVDVKASLTGKVLTNGRLNAFMAIAEPDDTPPGMIADLATSDPGSNTMRLTWTATGDDGNTGRAVRYEIRHSPAPITEGNFGSATLVTGPDPQTAGSAESFTVPGLTFSTTYHFAVKAFDEFNNGGPISNVPAGTTLGAPDIAAAPGSFSATLLSGANATQTLTLTNTAEGTLDFTIPTPALQFGAQTPHPYVAVSKGGEDPRPGINGSGGPDAFGYRWVDSDAPNGPSFAWVDITGVGTQLSMTGDDAISAAIPMGMTFPFYGNNFTTVRICTNGFLSFTDGSTAFDNQPLPSSGGPANLLAPLWDDLDFGATARVWYHSDGARFIVSWIAAPHYGAAPNGPYTFQAILYPSGEIRYQYLTLGAPTNQATVGIQNAAKNAGLTVAFNAAYLHDNLAVRIVTLPQWLTVTPTSGRVLAGQSMDLGVRFDAVNMDGGTFDGSIRVLSNDPDEGEVTLAAQLTVVGAPDIDATPTALDFGSFFAGGSQTRSVLVSNPGTAPLNVTSLVFSAPNLSADTGPFTLGPRAARNVQVTWAPPSPATLNGTLTLNSDDPDEPAIVVTLTGAATPAPSFAVNPESFDVSLLTNTATTRNLRVSNSGGSNYVFTAEAIATGPGAAQSGGAPVHVFGESDNIFVPKMPDVSQDDTELIDPPAKSGEEIRVGGFQEPSGPMPLRAGGPDAFGYTYADSDEPTGPTFSWVDIRSVGTNVVMTGDDANTGAHPIGFSFPFYGRTFNSFRICTNGWISFTSTRTNFSNVALPNSGSTIPENLLAVFWDDLHFDAVRKAYYHYDGTKLVIQYQDVRRLGETATANPNTFEILLYPDGTIVYQYLTMSAANKTSCTIGIQNQEKNDGLQVVFNAAYIKNNLAIRFRPPSRFLTVTPGNGTVPPGGFVDLTVGFNAAGLFGGDYTGAVRINGNDPVVPQRNLPAILHVTGVPDVAAVPASLGFGSAFIGFPRLMELRINNTGTDQLVVSNITSDHADYGVNTTNLTLPPLGNALVLVSFNPSATGPRPATLTIHSNDPDTPALAVPLTGSGQVAPDIGSTPASVSATVNIPDSDTRTLTVHNTGGSDLNFVVGTQLTASAAPVYEAIELGKEEADPRPGVLGSGGPDVFGYRWFDSDDPGGPVFDWVDITGIGTPINLTGTGDDVNVPGLPIGFNFPFYGGTFNTVNVCSNGWLSFTNTTTDLSNDPLPNTAAPENLLAVFWDDLDPDVTPTRLYRYSDGTRFIVSYVGVPRFSSGGPYTFQVILYPSGRIVYQYLSMQGTRLNEATIGIQNAAENDGLTVVHNGAYMHDNLAIEFRTIPEYMTVSPSTGTIPAGGSTDLTVQFNTAGLFGGVYDGALRITSNDPDEGVFTVPTSLTAVGVPDVAADPASVDFGTIYVGQTADRTVDVVNTGSDVLQVTGLNVAAPWSIVGAPSLPVALGQNGRLTLTLRFAPVAECVPPNPCAATLEVATNDPDEPVTAVPLSGIGLIPPEIGVTPASLRSALATTLGPTALTETKTLTIQNTGGSDLTWSAEALSALPAAANVVEAEAVKGDDGGPGALGAGGPDAAGYRWADSDDPIQGTPFDWVDITGVGTPIAFNGDDQNLGPFPLPFPVTFYGNTFTSFRACTNGWISFTSSQTTFSNTVLPNAAAAAPPNLIAAFWDDLDFRPANGNGRAYYHYDGSKLIVSYHDVPHLGGSGTYTFQILIYPSGTIDVQYLSMAGLLNSATIGIQNSTKDVGLQVAFNSAYVHDNLRVRFTRQQGWLTVAPASGVIPAGGTATLQVGFDATGLADGDYSGVVRVHSNDLDEPTTTVACDLHVGVQPAAFDFDPNSLNPSSNGQWVSGKTAPAPLDPNDIVMSSVLLQRTVPVDPDAPTSVDNASPPARHMKFDRAAVIPTLSEGDAVPVEIIYKVGDNTWCAGVDYIRVHKPHMAGGGAESFEPGINHMPGQQVPMAWDAPAGATPTHYELWYSPDGGTSWSLVQGGMTGTQYLWTVPTEATEAAILDLVAMDALGAMGSWISPTFTIGEGSTPIGGARESALGVRAPVELPKTYGLKLAGANPARDRATVELALPAESPVEVGVYDLRGARIRSLANGTLPAGWHPLTWDGRTEGGVSTGAGVYFIRGAAGGETFFVRLVMLR